jgi:FKBP-type peptidyl-prolyl cis-trans isomerase FklB
MGQSIMPIFFTRAATLFASGALLLGVASAQDQTVPAKTTSTAPAAKTQSGTTAKTPAAGAKKPATAAPLTLKTQKEKFSYALGMTMGASLHKQAVAVDPTILARGMKDGIAGGKTLMTEQDAQAALTVVQNEVRAKQQEKMKELADTNQKEGETFLAANKAKDGVVTLPSGLQYKVETQGTGPKPTATDTVTCNYRGTLVNGTEFDSSYASGKPVSFPVNGVIKGWTEALQLMPVGSKWQLFIPPDLAYGPNGRRPSIEPQSTLIFEVELVSIQAPDQKAPDKPQQ